MRGRWHSGPSPRCITGDCPSPSLAEDKKFIWGDIKVSLWTGGHEGQLSVVIPKKQKDMCILDGEIPSPLPDSVSRNLALEAGDWRTFLDGI